MHWYNKAAAEAAESRVRNNLASEERRKSSSSSSGPRDNSARRAAEIQENRIRNALRDRDNRSYKDRVDAGYDRSRFRAPPEVERPARPVTVYSEKYKPRPMRPSDYKGGPIIDNKTGKPVNAPKGFGAAAKAYGTSKFPKVFAGVLRRNPFLSAADLLAMIFDYLSKQPKEFPNPKGLPILPPNYYWDPAPTWPEERDWITDYQFGSAGSSSVAFPLYFQGSQLEPLPLMWHSHYYLRNYSNGVFGNRAVLVGNVTRTYTLSPQPQPTRPFVSMSAAANPNLQRHASGQPNRSIDPTLDNIQAVGRAKENARIADQRIEVMARGLARRQIPHARIPPDRGVRERKGLTKLAKFGIALAGALDTMSEGAELIDAIYDALPEDVKKRWEAGVKKDYSIYTTVRQGDNYGQYGLDGADWKVRAIYHNWDKIDIAEAGRNILKNHISDKIIGKYQSGMPVNIGNAVGGGEMYAAKAIDKALDYAIDSAVGLFR